MCSSGLGKKGENTMVKERLSEAEVLLHICIIAILQQMKKKKKLSV